MKVVGVDRGEIVEVLAPANPTIVVHVGVVVGRAGACEYAAWSDAILPPGNIIPLPR